MRTALIMILIAIIALLSNYNILHLNLGKDWPWILLFLGIYYFFQHIIKHNKKTISNNTYSKEERLSILRKLQNGEIDIDEAMDKLNKK